MKIGSPNSVKRSIECKPLMPELNCLGAEVMVPFDDQFHLKSSAKRMRFFQYQAESSSITSVSSVNVHRSIYNFTKGYDDICQLNTKLEMKLRQKDFELELMRQSHGQKLAEFEWKIQGLLNDRNESNQKLMALEKMFEELEQLSLKGNQSLISHNEKAKLVEEHERKMNDLIAKKDAERMQALADAKQQYEQIYSAALDEAKGHKFCIRCGGKKPIGIFVCGLKCLQRARWVEVS